MDNINESKADATALWYILIGKKNVLASLYRTEPSGKKKEQLLSNDFSLPRWQKAAMKNATALRSKKKYTLSIAFFILANELNEAINVALERARDLNLAILIARMCEPNPHGPVQDRIVIPIVEKYMLEEAKRADDPWLASIALWW